MWHASSNHSNGDHGKLVLRSFMNGWGGVGVGEILTFQRRACRVEAANNLLQPTRNNGQLFFIMVLLGRLNKALSP